MKVYVVGAGAVGRYLGELLRATGNEVVYAPRDLAAIGHQQRRDRHRRNTP